MENFLFIVILLSFFAFIFGLVNIIYPLKFFKINTRKKAAVFTFITFAVCIVSLTIFGSMQPPTPEQLEQQQKAEAQKQEQEKLEAQQKAEEEKRIQEQREAEEARKQAEEASKEQEKLQAEAEKQAAIEEDKRKGFHCLSAWDGSHKQFVELLKRQLNDPKSFEHVETMVTPLPDGQETGSHGIIMEFRANNAFGGLVLNTAVGVYDHDSCEAVLVSVE